MFSLARMFPCISSSHAWLISELGPARLLTRSGRSRHARTGKHFPMHDSSRTLQKRKPAYVRWDQGLELVGTTRTSVSSWHGSGGCFLLAW
jgi:hypothetical protein